VVTNVSIAFKQEGRRKIMRKEARKTIKRDRKLTKYAKQMSAAIAYQIA